MKRITLILVFLSAAANAKPCDQKLYDKLYRLIIIRSITEKDQKLAVEDRNTNIRFLRDLCKGQYSSYEYAYRHSGPSRH